MSLHTYSGRGGSGAEIRIVRASPFMSRVFLHIFSVSQSHFFDHGHSSVTLHLTFEVTVTAVSRRTSPSRSQSQQCQYVPLSLSVTVTAVSRCTSLSWLKRQQCQYTPLYLGHDYSSLNKHLTLHETFYLNSCRCTFSAITVTVTELFITGLLGSRNCPDHENVLITEVD